MLAMFRRWARRRAARIEAEEERLERIEARRQAYRDRDESDRIVNVATALGGALDRTFQIESKLLEQMGGFLGVLQEARAPPQAIERSASLPVVRKPYAA
jgi:hypothetical protein